MMLGVVVLKSLGEISAPMGAGENFRVIGGCDAVGGVALRSLGALHVESAVWGSHYVGKQTTPRAELFE